MEIGKTFFRLVKLRIIYIFCFLAIGLFLPLHFALAWPWDAISRIINIVSSLPYVMFVMIILMILYLIIVLTSVFAAISAALLSWIVNTDILLTRCEVGQDCIVEFGWALTRDLANMFFILIFVAIAFAYILKLETFGMKKALPMLIVVALLINFSAVFVGIFVDIGQILLNAFLVDLSGLSLLFNAPSNFALQIWEQGILKFQIFQLTGQMKLIAGGIAYIIFNVALGLILLMYALLFIIRIIALWILTILAPLAFLCLILPQTKGIWSKWLSQVFQWSFIGVIAMFYLFLGLRLLNFLSHNEIGTSGWTSNFETFGLDEVLMSFMPYIMFVVILFIGFTTAIAGTPAAAQGVMNMAKKAGSSVATKTKDAAWKRTREQIPKEWKQNLRQLSATENPSWGKDEKGAAGWMKRRFGEIAGKAERTISGAPVGVLDNAEKADEEKARKRAETQNVHQNSADINNATGKGEKAAIVEKMGQRDQLKDVTDPDVKLMWSDDKIVELHAAAAETDNKEAQKYLENVFGNKPQDGAQPEPLLDAKGQPLYDLQGNPVNTTPTLSKRFGDNIDRNTKNKTDPDDHTQNGLTKKDRDERGYNSYNEKIIAEIKTSDDIKKLQKNWWNSPEAMEAVHKFWGGHQISMAATTFGRDFISAFDASKKSLSWYNELIQRKDSKGNTHIATRNSSIPRYLASSGAQSLGISPIEGAATMAQVNELNTLTNAWSSCLSNLDTNTANDLQNQLMVLQAILEDYEELKTWKNLPETEERKSRIEEIANRCAEREEELMESLTTLMTGSDPNISSKFKTIINITKTTINKKRKESEVKKENNQEQNNNQNEEQEE